MSRLRLLSKQPESPVEWLVSHMQHYLHIPDPAPVYALLGAFAANILEGPPLWLMFVGPPGCGKTALLSSLSGIQGMHAVDSLDGPAAFLSGTGKRDKARDATGGLLNMLGAHGGLIIKDFTGILSLDSSRRRQVLDCLRQAYDGSWTRPVGADGGKTLRWEGHAALFAGVTGEIDQHHAVSNSLGERWVYFRFDAHSSNQFAFASRALTNAARPGWSEELRDLVTAFVLSQDMDFGRRVGYPRPSNAEQAKIIRMAGVAARCRSSVARDLYKRDVVGVPETESTARLATQLGKLYAGMEYVGVAEDERWRVLAKIALDSMPLMRRLVIREIVQGKSDGAGYPQLVSRVGISESVLARCVEDLEMHGVVVSSSKDRRSTVIKLSEFMRTEWEWAKWGS